MISGSLKKNVISGSGVIAEARGIERQETSIIMFRFSDIQVHALRIGVGAAAFAFGVYTQVSSRGVESVVAILEAILAGLVAGICLFPYIVAPLLRWAESLYMPTGKHIRLPRDFCTARALVRSGDAVGAAAELRSVIAEAPDDALDAELLLAQVLYDELRRPEEALAVVRKALSTSGWRDEVEPVACLGADILLEQGRTTEARELLGQAVKRAETGAQAEQLRKRLQHI